MTEDFPPALPPAHDGSRFKWLMWPISACVLVIGAQMWHAEPWAQQEFATPADGANRLAARLNPTAHPAVPPTLEAMWLVSDARPPAAQTALAGLARGVRLLDEGGDATEALRLVSAPALAKTDVADYARYYTGIAYQRLSKWNEADAIFTALEARKVDAQLPEAAAYRHAEVREALDDFAGAAVIYEQLLSRKVASPQIALVRLGSVAAAAGDRVKAIEAHRRVLREFTLSSEAAEAEELLERLDGFTLDTPEAVQAEAGRAEALLKARKWDQARSAYDRLRGRTGVDADRVTFRLAQIQAGTGQHRNAREVFRRYVGHDTFAAEAQYGLVGAALALRETDEFKQLSEDFVARFPTHPLAEIALNELARQHVLADEDGKAAEVYARLVARFPNGALAERATWKAGWWAYREKNFRETIRFFEQGAATFPRSDYRPSWLYWTARAYDQLSDQPAATERYRLTATDYRNSYYGRLAWKQLEARNEASVIRGVQRPVVIASPPPPNAGRITRLIELELYRPALNELRFAQKVWGDSPQLQATAAFVHNRMGDLRLGINAMKRAYPQYLAAGGESLPDDILRVLFPVDYWPLLRGHAQAHGLDPYVVAALVAQESTFDAGIRSSANAIGLMQVLPSTGRRYARKMGIRPFSERSLTTAETNVRIGTRFFADLVKRFGDSYFALASYNAGEHRVQRWLNETPGLPQDEFIDNIPFPETQNYVKRILGTADDYRRLYGEGVVAPAITRPATAKPPAKRTVSPPTKKKAAPARKR